MFLINWNDKFSVNVKEIDEQHKKLVNLINKLSEAMSKGQSKTVLGSILEELAAYTVTHFSTEEKYFHQFAYKHTAEHEKQHSGLIKKVSDFKNEFEKGNVALSIELLQFLKDWLLTHIADSDKKYSQCFKDNGLL